MPKRGWSSVQVPPGWEMSCQRLGPAWSNPKPSLAVITVLRSSQTRWVPKPHLDGAPELRPVPVAPGSDPVGSGGKICQRLLVTPEQRWDRSQVSHPVPFRRIGTPNWELFPRPPARCDLRAGAGHCRDAGSIFIPNFKGCKSISEVLINREKTLRL